MMEDKKEVEYDETIWDGGVLTKVKYIKVTSKELCKLNGRKQYLVYLGDVEFVVCDSKEELDGVKEFVTYGYGTKKLNKNQKNLLLKILDKMDRRYGIRIYGTTGYTGEIMDADGWLKKGIKLRIPNGEMQIVKIVGKYEKREGVC